MQRLTVDFITSLDGYGAADGWPGWWGMESPEYLRWLDQSPEKDHPILMGAKTYRLMSALVASGESGTEGLTATPKVVFSSTLTEPLTWANTTLVRTDAAAAVRVMKQESDRPLRTLGSVSLCRTLLNAGLVDLFRVVIFPVITGATGTDRIFAGYPDVRLQVTNSRSFEGGLQLLEYVPTVLEGPPGGGPDVRS